MAKDYSAITPDILKLSELCSGNSVINSEMYLEHKVFRGLRDLNGNGVLTGLTEVSEIQSFQVGENGEKHPCRGQLFYRGINVEELVGGFIKDNRFGFEETTYLLLFGDLPDREELENFTGILSGYRTLPGSFVRDIIMKAPSHDMMNTLARSVLTLYAYDSRPNDTSIPNVLRQCLQLIALFPLLSVYGYQVKSGRGFTQADYDNFRKVALVDANTVSTLFGGEDPVGKSLEVKGDVFTVVGVVALSKEFTPTIETLQDYLLYADTSSGCLYIPSTVWPTAFQFDEPQNVAIKVKNTDTMATAGKEAADLLTQKQIVDSENSDFDYRSQDMLEQAQQLQKMSQSTNTQLIWIASISLLVGGIGVMNIMLVSVTERTAEIGLKKAIGARKKRILLQFLTESAVLTSLGGIIGVISGVILAELISNMMQIPVSISAPAIIVAVVFSTFIGVVFGMLPAYKAANLNPIEALRRD